MVTNVSHALLVGGQGSQSAVTRCPDDFTAFVAMLPTSLLLFSFGVKKFIASACFGFYSSINALRHLPLKYSLTKAAPQIILDCGIVEF